MNIAFLIPVSLTKPHYPFPISGLILLRALFIRIHIISLIIWLIKLLLLWSLRSCAPGLLGNVTKMVFSEALQYVAIVVCFVYYFCVGVIVVENTLHFSVVDRPSFYLNFSRKYHFQDFISNHLATSKPGNKNLIAWNVWINVY